MKLRGAEAADPADGCAAGDDTPGHRAEVAVRTVLELS